MPVWKYRVVRTDDVEVDEVNLEERPTGRPPRGVRLLVVAVVASITLALGAYHARTLHAADAPIALSDVLWGVRGHTVIDRVAVRTIPNDGPTFLSGQEEWVAYQAIVPDLWRKTTEPFLKIVEDPNHGWFREPLAFLHEIPRSRYEFVLALYDEHKRLLAAGDTAAAAVTNVRWTGTLPYAAVENYERMIPAMRRYRQARATGGDTHFIEIEIGSYLARLGHYIGDGAQPLHVTVSHDGWVGPNPNGYATDHKVHGRFESRFVNAMTFEPSDVQKLVPPAKVLDDPFQAILAHLDTSATYVEEVYRLDKDGALATGKDPAARALVLQQLSRGAALLRDLAYTAWVRSGDTTSVARGESPLDPHNPRYNPATGSAPAPLPPAVSTRR